MIRPERSRFSGSNFEHVSLVISRVQLPDPDRLLKAVLNHVERGEGDDLRQAGLAHVDVHPDVVAAAQIFKKKYLQTL